MPVYLAHASGGREMKETIDGTEIFYRIEGEGSSRILLLHGWGCSMKLMQPVADALQTSHTTLLVDLPGHGGSGKPPEPWGVPEYASCVKKLLEHLSFTPCSVIAHSFGCRIATWLEAENPEMFDKIVFTGAAGIRPEASEKAKNRSRRYQTLKQYCKTAEKVPLIKKLAPRWEEKLIQKYGSPDYAALDTEMRKTFVRVINQDLSDLYRNFKAPTLLIWGDKDTETPLWMAQKMQKSIPDAGIVVFEGGDHFAYLQQSQRFNTIVRHFLKGDG